LQDVVTSAIELELSLAIFGDSLVAKATGFQMPVRDKLQMTV
jgi:hypothetical protein